MKKYMLLIAASLVASAIITGCGSPAEGNTETTPSTTTTPEANKPADTTTATPEANAPAPAPEDKK